MKRTVFFVYLLITCMRLYGQAPTLQQKLYYTCKVWGFIKYYHSNVNACNVNWDSVLLHTLPMVRSAATNNEFNDALDSMLLAAGPMTLSSTYFPDTLPTALKRNRDWTWISSPVFRSDVQVQLDTIKNNFRPHIGCWAIYASSSIPTFPYDSLVINTDTHVSMPGSDSLLLALYKYWNLVRYFNPYNYVIDTSWDTTLMRQAVVFSSITNADDLFNQFLKIAASLQDAHVSLLSFSTYTQRPPGPFHPLIRFKYMGGTYVVIKSSEPGVNIGDAILAIDGLTTTQWEDSLKPYYSYGNPAVMRRILCDYLSGRMANGMNETLVVEDSTGVSHSISVSCKNPASYSSFFNDAFYPADSLANIQWTTMPCDIGYINYGTLQTASVSTMYDDLQNKSTIIIDLRNGAATNIGYITNLLYPASTVFSKFLQPAASYPGTFYWSNNYIGTSSATPYSGKIIILVNEETQSMLEYSCMALEQMPHVLKVGSQTAGADGTVLRMKLSQDIYTGYTSQGVFYPNGDSTQRIGVVPDTVVYPTRTGIRHHRDEVLEKALSMACTLQAGSMLHESSSINVFPNPAADAITISANNTAGKTSISITDITGRELICRNIDKTPVYFSTVINISMLPPGVYLVKITSGQDWQVTKFIKQ